MSSEDDDDLDGPYDPVEKAVSAALREAVRIQREADAAASGLLTVRQASTYLATSTTTVRSLAKAGAIRSATIGAGLRFRRSWLDQWIDAGGGKIERAEASVEPNARAVSRVVRTARSPARNRPAANATLKKPIGPVPAARTDDGRAIFLLRPDPPFRTGIAHYGFEPKAPLCGRPSDKPLKVVSVETRWFGRDNASCRPCLNEAGRLLGPRVVDLGLDRLTMRTVARRGDAVAVRNEGAHTGNGRTTWCGKTRDEWDLAFRSPGGSVRRCIDCEEHEIYLGERDHDSTRGATVVSDPLFCRGVLLDYGTDADALIALVRRAPGVFDVRRSTAPLQEPTGDDFDPFCTVYLGAAQVLGPRRPLQRWCGVALVVSATLEAPGLVVLDEEAAMAWVRPLVSRAERRATLRAAWDGKTKMRGR